MRVIVLELSELCPALMQRFMGQGRLPHFQRLHAESHVYTTEAEERAPHLEPWIQWITVHSGLPYREHRCQEPGDGARLAAPNVWDVLSGAGLRVWVCGSMNLQYRRPVNGWVLPDPWTVAVAPHPAALRPYFRFVRAHVTEHTRDRVPLGPGERLAFLAFMSRHGLSAATALAIAGQLAAQRLAEPAPRWRRAVLLDRLQVDLFRWYWRRGRPHFATLCLDSTAHFQHRCGRHMEPEGFRVQPSPRDRELHGDAIRFGYERMDALVGRILALADGDTTVILASALSHVDLLESGRHHPDGLLWIRSPARAHAVFADKVPLTVVAPTLVGMFGIDPPATMAGAPLAAPRRAA